METFRSVPMEIYFALAFMLIDVVTGVLKAVKNKDLNSTKAREGIYKKASFIIFIVFGYLAEFAMNYVDLGFNFPAGTTVCLLVILTEAISVLENLGNINPELVALVAPFLSALNGKKDGELK